MAARHDDEEIIQSWKDGMEIMRLCGNSFERGSYLSLLNDPIFWQHVHKLERVPSDQQWDRAKAAWDAERRGAFSAEITNRDYEPGYIYILHADNHVFKIGKTKNIVDDRVKQIGLVVPMEVRLVSTIFTDALSAYERFLHRAHWHRHVRGEWFRLSFWEFADLASRYTALHFFPEPNSELAAMFRSIARDYEFGTMPGHWFDEDRKRIAAKKAVQP